MLREGRSFSGKERNCVFLNTLGEASANEQFATISAVSGADFPEDGRAVIQVDWDQDGDLDLWFSNRNEPRLRFLRNDLETKNQHIQFRLVGNGLDTNRNAIGAQIRITTREQRDAGTLVEQIREIRAGDAFISQNTLTAHFGLGQNSKIEKVEVRWPNHTGTTEVFSGVTANGRFWLKQGTGVAETIEKPSLATVLNPSKLQPSTTTENQRIPLLSRFLGPKLSYKSLDGNLQVAVPDSSQVTLLNLWSTTCAPCLKELGEFSKRHSELQENGIRVVALCIDELEGGLFDADSGDPVELTRAIVNRLKMPFIAGMATPELVSQVQRLHNSMVEGVRPVPLPTSFLIDRDGRLDVIYKGTVSVEQLLEDAKPLTDQSIAARFSRSAMLPGRLLEHDSAMTIVENATAQAHIKLARELAQENRIPEAIAEYEQGLEVLQDSAFMQNDLATLLTYQGEFDRAIPIFRRSIELDPKNPQYRINLAQALLSVKKPDQARSELTKLLQDSPRNSEAHFYLGVVETRLNQNDSAAKCFEKAIQFDQENARAHFSLGSLRVSQGRFRDAQTSFEAALEIEPREVVVLTNLSSVLLRLGQVESAEQRIRQAIRIQPAFADAHYQMGVLQASKGDDSAAKTSFAEALRLQPGHPASIRAMRDIR